MDDGFVSAPSSHVWNPEGKYDIENIGMPPDIEVEMDPELVRQGRDPQLEKAIEVVLKDLEKNPVVPAEAAPIPQPPLDETADEWDALTESFTRSATRQPGPPLPHGAPGCSTPAESRRQEPRPSCRRSSGQANPRHTTTPS